MTHGEPSRVMAIGISWKMERHSALIPMQMRSIDIQIIYLTDPSAERESGSCEGKMAVIRRADDHHTSRGEKDEFVGVRQTPGATTYYPLGGRNSPLERLYSDNPTFPFQRRIWSGRDDTFQYTLLADNPPQIPAGYTCPRATWKIVSASNEHVTRGWLPE